MLLVEGEEEKKKKQMKTTLLLIAHSWALLQIGGCAMFMLIQLAPLPLLCSTSTFTALQFTLAGGDAWWSLLWLWLWLWWFAAGAVVCVHASAIMAHTISARVCSLWVNLKLVSTAGSNCKASFSLSPSTEALFISLLFHRLNFWLCTHCAWH